MGGRISFPGSKAARASTGPLISIQHGGSAGKDFHLHFTYMPSWHVTYVQGQLWSKLHSHELHCAISSQMVNGESLK